MQLNRGLSVWQKPKDFFHQILSLLWKGLNKRLRGQTINKTATDQNHTEPKRTKTVIWNQAIIDTDIQEVLIYSRMSFRAGNVGVFGACNFNQQLYITVITL